MQKRMIGSAFLALSLALPVAHANGEAQEPYQRVFNASTYDVARLSAAGHPNELQRVYGIWNYDNGRREAAVDYFQRAAYYGDKLSQHLLTLMYWEGDGVERDPVLAYIWADLAAERGNNELLLKVREKLWSELTPDQRERVLEIGADYADRYGDAAARPRANARIRQFAHQRTGSRVGAQTSKLQINAGNPELWASGAKSSFGQYYAAGEAFYAAERTRPGDYWQAEDRMLRALLGAVKVGEIEIVRPPEAQLQDD